MAQSKKNLSLIRKDAKSKIFFVLCVFVLISFSTLHAQEQRTYSPAEVMEKVQQTYAALTDASAKFTQKVFFKYTKVEQVFSGTVLMKKGNKYRVESQQQTIVTDGKTVWLYSPLNQQVLIDHYAENKQTFSPEKFLLGLPKNYSAAFLNEDVSSVNATYVLKLAPKSKGDAPSVIKSLKVWVNEKDWSVRKIEYIDLNDTRSMYTLHDIVFNAGIDESKFQFTTPSGCEIVDVRSLQQHSSEK